MTAYSEEQKRARREVLYSKTINELVEYIISMEEEVLETKQYRARLMKIRNIVLEPEERRKPGRPHKDDKVL